MFAGRISCLEKKLWKNWKNNKIKLALASLVVKKIIHTKFILQNKLCQSLLLYYWYGMQEIGIMFKLKILVDLWLTKQSIMEQVVFVDIASNASTTQKYSKTA